MLYSELHRINYQLIVIYEDPMQSTPAAVNNNATLD
jgi:hypothetical protein